MDIEPQSFVDCPGVQAYSKFPNGFVENHQIMAPVSGFIDV